MPREYTNKLLEMVEEGVLDKDTVIMALVKYLSESDVQDCMEINGFLDSEEYDDEEDDADDEEEDDEEEDDEEEEEDGEE